MSTDRISLAHWFPILQSTGVKVPKTEWWHTSADFWPWADGKESKSASAFMRGLKQRLKKWEYPVFLRTGHTSAKHSWKDSCYVESEERLRRCVWELIEFSLMQIFELPIDIWVIREFLDLDIRFSAFWGDMPIATERRYFVEDGRVICSHPYWPAEAFERTHPKPEDWVARLAEMNAVEIPQSIRADSEHVSAHFEGAWSLDWARHSNGSWYAIDMAPAEVSYHWPDCDIRDQQ
jgi:hypothetical protein